MNVPLQQYRDLLGTYLKPHRRRVALLAALLLGGIGLQLLNPQIIRSFIDTAQSGGPQPALATAAAVFIAIGLAQRAAALASMYVGENLGWAATNALRADLARHCLRLDMSFHKRHTPGELIERIDGDVTALANFFSQLIIRIAGNVLLIGAVLLLLLREDWRAGAGLAAYTIVTFIALGAVQNLAVERWAAERQASAEQFGFLEERISGTEDIRASGAEQYVLRRLYRLMGDLLKKNRDARLASNLTFVITNFMLAAGYALGLGIGAYLYSRGDVSIGTAYLIVYYIGMLSGPLENIRTQFEDLQQASASIGRVRELLRLRPLVREATRAALPAGTLAVEFEAVSFEYDDRPPTADHRGGAEEQRGREGEGEHSPPTDARMGVLHTPATDVERERESDHRPPTGEGKRSRGGEREHGPPTTDARMGVLHTPATDVQGEGEGERAVLRDVSFGLEPGKVLGLLGRTGSGKTTLTRLLFRLYDPGAGAIRLGGVDIRDVALDDLRGRVGMVTQDVQLFQASIRDNLTFFDRRIGDNQIERALRELGLWEWVRARPAGLETRLAAGGQGLSAGEAQLLAFARVFLKDPGLVIMDEASSRLDPATERLLERAVDRLLHGRTGIIIAHRLRTVQRADQIMVLERGRIAEHGPRAQLAADPGSHFYRLLQTGLEEALA